MSEQPWFRSEVVYQIYPRSFSDSNGDGIGDLRGIIDRLDHLEQLGVGVVWLSPIYPSPQDDNGYDISDYEDIEPAFGTLADFDELLAGLHQRGIKLVMDLVVNHTSDEHAWFVESRSSATSPKRDWYWWAQPRDGYEAGAPGAEPTNWTSFFSGSTWELDPGTGEYYLHLFSKKQPDLNWENEAVRREVYAMMNRWLDRGVDGFRMDVINMISKVLPLVDGVVHDGHVLGDGTPFVINGPRLHEYLQEMYAAVFAERPGELLTVGETPATGIEDARLFSDPARRELDMIFQFEHMDLDHGRSKWDSRPFSLVKLKRSLGRWQEALAETGWNSLYWNNHDQPRVVSRFGDDRPVYRVASAKALATVLHLHRGTPYVYQGEELGMTNAPFATIEDFRDIESLNHYAEAVGNGADPEAVLGPLRTTGRDNARTPVQWDASPNAGFTTGTPWIAVNPNHVEINAAAQRNDPDSVFHHYRRLIELRRTVPAIAHGDFTMLAPDDEHLYAFTRRFEGTELLTVANIGSDPLTVGFTDVVEWSSADELIQSGDRVEQPDGQIVLGPWEARVLRRTT